MQPYLALGMGLAIAGHDVRIVGPEEFATMAKHAGLPFAPLSKAREEIVKISSGAAEKGTLATIRLMLAELPRRVGRWTTETLEGCEGAEILLGGIGGMVTGLAVAEKLGVPFIRAQLQPVGVPTSDYPGVLVAGLPIWRSAFGRRVSHFISDAGIGVQFGGAAGAASRKVLNLSGPRPPADPRLTLFGFSRQVVPVPPSPDREVTGYWAMSDTTWSPPTDLGAFHVRGRAPWRRGHDRCRIHGRSASGRGTFCSRPAILGQPGGDPSCWPEADCPQALDPDPPRCCLARGHRQCIADYNSPGARLSHRSGKRSSFRRCKTEGVHVVTLT